jgi:hypothetical protein
MNALLKLLPAPTKDQTAKGAIAALASLGFERTKVTYDPGEFQLLIDSHRIWLGNLQAQLRHAWPWKRAAVTRQFLSFLSEQPERPKTLEEARPHLLPGVRDSFIYEALRLQAQLEGLKNPRPSGYALGSRLWLSSFLDYPNSTSVVTVSDIESWGSSSERCLELALENLAAKSKEGLVQTSEGIYHSPWHDCYDPARILLRDVLGPLDIKGDPVAFAPNWNHLLITGSEHLEGLGGCLIFAMKILAEEPRPMTPLPLVRRGGQWVDFDLPKGHAVEPLLRKARVLELNRVYTDQAALIEKIHEKDGTDIYVAQFNGTYKKDTDDYDSWSVWSKGVVTLLPRTERVMFFDNDKPETEKIVADVDWRIVSLQCAPLMKDAGFTPPRYLVESFPTPEQLEAMRGAQASRAAD